MARPGLNDNRKFRSLIQRLRLPRPYARGLLESLWDVANACGLPLLGTSDEVEASAEWPGERGMLFAALKECKFICQKGCGCSTDTDDDRAEHWPADGWRIHDYWNNAVKYAHSRAIREGERSQQKVCCHCHKGYHSEDRRSKYCCDACKTAACRAKNKPLLPSVTDRNVTVTECYGPPTPTPTPVLNTPLTPLAGGNELFAAQEPQAETPKAKTPRKRKRKIEQAPPGFERFWAAYPNPAQCPRRVGKAKCVTTWMANGLEDQADQIVAAVEAAKKTQQWRDQGGKFIPHTTTFLNGQRWEAFADVTTPTVYQPKTYQAPWAGDPVVAKVMALPDDQRATLRQQVLDQESDQGTRRWLERQDDRNPEMSGRIVALLENAEAYDPTMATAQQKGSAKAFSAAG